MKTCQYCEHWQGKDTDYMSDCGMIKRRTEFNDTCEAFTKKRDYGNMRGSNASIIDVNNAAKEALRKLGIV